MRTSLSLFCLPICHVLSSQIPFNEPTTKHSRLISRETEQHIHTLLQKWGSSGLSVAIVRKDASQPNGWLHEFGAYGIAHSDGSPMNSNSVFSIASNSKLFLSFSVGLLISNRTLAQERGQNITWTTKIRDLIPEWGLMDEEMERGVTLQDMLSHRTGMPRHDFSGTTRNGGISEVISTLRYLKPSAEFRETFQYNNIMYEVLSHLPQVLLNQTYESYVHEHLFKPLNMTASTFSVAEAETSGNLADGFQHDMYDITRGKNGTLTPTVPYFLRPGTERIWAGAGGVFSSARDLAIWVSMLINNGRHPFTNKTIVPEEVVKHAAYGRSVSNGEPEFPDTSPKVYGAGQWRYSYQGHAIIEHGGNNFGYKSQIARFPDDNLGIVVLSNDSNGGFLLEAVKFRIADELLGLKQLDWNERYEKLYNDYVANAQKVTEPPSPPNPPSAPFIRLSATTFSHPTYGTLRPCLVPETVSYAPPVSPSVFGEHCKSLPTSYPVQRLLSDSNMSIPTYIIPFKRMFATHMRLAHFDKNLFNVTVFWSNAEVREREGYGRAGAGGDLILGWEEHFEAEWVLAEGDVEEGLAFKGGFWGKEGPDSRSPGGTGKESAEVWFGKIQDYANRPLKM